MGRIIGIDLGTTNSCVAVIEGNEPIVLPNAEGARTTPSVVAITENRERLVGQQAKRQAIINPERTISGVKRLIGRKFDSAEVDEIKGLLPYRITDAANGDCLITINGQDYSPQEISAFVLQKMKSTAEDYFGEPVTEAVITVPAYFDDAMRQATKDAGRIAGLDVKRIINEPTAAALAYGSNAKANACIAVFDLGGGTFDVSILRLRSGVYEVIATCGDNALGGDDFDRAILRRLVAVFEERTGINIAGDKMALQRLREASEAAKCELSSLNETNINLPFLAVDETGPRHLTYALTRVELNDLTAALIDRLELPCETAFGDAGIRPEEIDDVLLVGGMSRMPSVQERVARIFGKRPNKSINPDEAIAEGAAIQGGIVGGEVSEVVLLDVTPLTLGIRVAGGMMSSIITRNSPIPTQRKKVFQTTEDDQEFVTIEVLQGESRVAADNRLLGNFTLAELPPAPAGANRIEVTFQIDRDGIVHVNALDVGSRRSQSIVISGQRGLTEDEIRRAQGQ